MASVAFVAFSIVVAALLAFATGVRIDADGIAVIAWLAAAMLVIAIIWRSSRGHTRLTDSLGTLGLVWSAGISCGMIAMLSLRLHMPMVDELLHAADRALMLDGTVLLGWLLRRGQWIFSIMAVAYNQTIPLLLLSIFALAVAGRRLEAWRATFCFIGSLLSICLIAILTPAKGLALWTPAAMLKHLPENAMRYFWANFDSFYAGGSPILGLNTIDGVISFPSLHAAMGLIIVAMWRHNGVLFAIAVTWMAFMLLATLPYGGHYIVDLIAGLSIAAAWFALSRSIERRSGQAAQVALA